MLRQLVLSGQQPLFVGNKRSVYQHPFDDRLLVKIVSPGTMDKRYGAGAKWYKRERRPGIYLSYFREAGEYICLRARDRAPSPAIQTLVGFAETDLGLGLVVEKLVDENGDIAPTLRTLLLRSGLTNELARQIDELVVELLRCGVLLTKLNTRNIVRAWNEKHGTRLVIYDGMGAKGIVPLKSVSEWANAYSTRRKANGLRAEIAQLLKTRPPEEIEAGTPALT